MTVSNDIPVFEPTLDLVKEWVEGVLDELEQTETISHFNIDEVENKSRDGFIPFTEGGYDGIGYAYLRDAIYSGYCPKVIQPYVDQELKDVQEAWDGENPEHTYEWLYDFEADEIAKTQGDLLNSNVPTPREVWQEKYSEFESEYLDGEGGTYFYKARVLFYDEDNSRNESGEPEAYFMAGINTDFEYGRDTIPWLSHMGGNPQCTEWVFERNIPVKDLTPELISELVDEAIDGFNKA